MRSLRLPVFCCLTFALAPAVLANAQTATRTVLTLSTPGTVPSSTLETLTAQVFDASNGVIARGKISFYDGTRLVGTGQIITKGSGPIGSAVIHARFGGGSHSLSAKFAGVTGLGNGSQSVVQVLTVNPSSSGGVTPTYGLALAASPSLTTPPYTLTASITANTPSAPTGTVSFRDLYTASEIATAPLVAGATQNLNYVQGTAPIPPAALPAYDYNNDGIPDLLSINTSTRVVSLALGKGDGTFQSLTVLYTASVNVPPVVADFNADGNLDVLLSNALLLGKGDGTFTQAPTPPSSGASPTAGDFDKDGAVDYAFVNAGNVYVGYGNGDGTFQTPIPQGSISDSISNSESRTADFNGDGIDDVVTTVFHGDGVFGNDLVVLLSNGNRTFQPYRPVNPGYNGARASSVTTGDFNGDGILDLAYVRPTFANPFQLTSAVYVNLGVGDGTFQPGANLTAAKTSTTQSVATGNFNGDGRLDLAVSSGSSLFLFFGTGDGSFATNTAVGPYTLASTSAAGTVSADLNSDGVLDVIIGTNTFIASATSSASATVTNLTLAGGGIHKVTAQYSPDGISTVNSNTINLSGTQSNTVLAASGFSPATGLHLNGSAALNGAKLRLTDSQPYQAGSAWSSSPLYMRSFFTSFDFQITNPDADGFTLTLQNAAPTALGSTGGELGFNFIPNSVALKFDLYNNAGEGSNSVGVYAAGDTLTGPGTMLPSNIDLHSGHQFYAQVTYNGSQLVLYLRDTSTNASYTFTKNNIDLVKMIGSDYAYVGFTGATGGLTSTVDILDWFYTPKVTINQPNTSDPGFTNGSAVTTSSNISLVDGGQGEAGSAWSTTPVNINNFDVTFNASVQDNTSGPAADGFTFTLQNSGPTALGTSGGELGFNFIPNSIAFKFDLYNNSGEGAPSVGLFNAGDTLTGASTVLPPSINLVGSNNYELKYDGTTLTMIINPGATNTFTYKTQVNLRNAVQGNTAYIGFTAGTGALTSAIQIYTWNTTLGID